MDDGLARDDRDAAAGDRVLLVIKGVVRSGKREQAGVVVPGDPALEEGEGRHAIDEVVLRHFVRDADGGGLADEFGGGLSTAEVKGPSGVPEGHGSGGLFIPLGAQLRVCVEDWRETIAGEIAGLLPAVGHEDHVPATVSGPPGQPMEGDG